MDYSFTANMEQELDKVARGQAQWDQVLDQFYGDFSQKLVGAQDPDNGMRANTPTDTDIECPACERHMQIRNGSTGVFLGCSGYGLKPKERCTKTVNLIPGEEAVDVDKDEEGESKLLRRLRKCDKCNSAMLSHLVDETRKMHVCSNNPTVITLPLNLALLKLRATTGRCLSAISAVRKCSSSLVDSASTLAVSNVKIPASFCVVESLRRQKQIP